MPDMQIQVNGKSLLLSDGSTVQQLVTHMDLLGKRIAVERNGDIVPKSTFAEVALQEGDVLEIVGAVGGG